VNEPAGASQTDRVKRASGVVEERPFFDRIEQVTVGNADCDAGNLQPREKTEMPRCVLKNGRARGC